MPLAAPHESDDAGMLLHQLLKLIRVQFQHRGAQQRLQVQVRLLVRAQSRLHAEAVRQAHGRAQPPVGRRLGRVVMKANGLGDGGGKHPRVRHHESEVGVVEPEHALFRTEPRRGALGLDQTFEEKQFNPKIISSVK